MVFCVKTSSLLDASEQVHDQIHLIVTKTGLAIGFIPRDDQVVRRSNRQCNITVNVAFGAAWLMALRCRMLPTRLLNDVGTILDQLEGSTTARAVPAAAACLPRVLGNVAPVTCNASRPPNSFDGVEAA